MAITKEIATLIARIKADTTSFDTGMKKSTTTAKSFGKLIAGTAFAGAIALGIKSAVRDFAQFEQTRR